MTTSRNEKNRLPLTLSIENLAAHNEQNRLLHTPPRKRPNLSVITTPTSEPKITPTGMSKLKFTFSEENILEEKCPDSQRSAKSDETAELTYQGYYEVFDESYDTETENSDEPLTPNIKASFDILQLSQTLQDIRELIKQLDSSETPRNRKGSLHRRLSQQMDNLVEPLQSTVNAVKSTDNVPASPRLAKKVVNDPDYINQLRNWVDMMDALLKRLSKNAGDGNNAIDYNLIYQYVIDTYKTEFNEMFDSIITNIDKQNLPEYLDSLIHLLFIIEKSLNINLSFRKKYFLSESFDIFFSLIIRFYIQAVNQFLTEQTNETLIKLYNALSNGSFSDIKNNISILFVNLELEVCSLFDMQQIPYQQATNAAFMLNKLNDDLFAQIENILLERNVEISQQEFTLNNRVFSFPSEARDEYYNNQPEQLRHEYEKSVYNIMNLDLDLLVSNIKLKIDNEQTNSISKTTFLLYALQITEQLKLPLNAGTIVLKTASLSSILRFIDENQAYNVETVTDGFSTPYKKTLNSVAEKLMLRFKSLTPSNEIINDSHDIASNDLHFEAQSSSTSGILEFLHSTKISVDNEELDSLGFKLRLFDSSGKTPEGCHQLRIVLQDLPSETDNNEDIILQKLIKVHRIVDSRLNQFHLAAACGKRNPIIEEMYKSIHQQTSRFLEMNPEEEQRITQTAA
ncbi:MAG: hypothetical protein ACE365_01900 [Gammaproteobacteria bacterium]